MGPMNLIACCQQMFSFNYCFNGYVGEKLDDGPVDHSAGLGVVTEALFLGSSRVHPKTEVNINSLTD
jgi:hypothetical protein